MRVRKRTSFQSAGSIPQWFRESDSFATTKAIFNAWRKHAIRNRRLDEFVEHNELRTLATFMLAWRRIARLSTETERLLTQFTRLRELPSLSEGFQTWVHQARMRTVRRSLLHTAMKMRLLRNCLKGWKIFISPAVNAMRFRAHALARRYFFTWVRICRRKARIAVAHSNRHIKTRCFRHWFQWAQQSAAHTRRQKVVQHFRSVRDQYNMQAAIDNVLHTARANSPEYSMIGPGAKRACSPGAYRQPGSSISVPLSDLDSTFQQQSRRTSSPPLPLTASGPRPAASDLLLKIRQNCTASSLHGYPASAYLSSPTDSTASPPYASVPLSSMDPVEQNRSARSVSPVNFSAPRSTSDSTDPWAVYTSTVPLSSMTSLLQPTHTASPLFTSVPLSSLSLSSSSFGSVERRDAYSSASHHREVNDDNTTSKSISVPPYDLRYLERLRAASPAYTATTKPPLPRQMSDIGPTTRVISPEYYLNVQRPRTPSTTDTIQQRRQTDAIGHSQRDRPATPNLSHSLKRQMSDVGPTQHRTSTPPSRMSHRNVNANVEERTRTPTSSQHPVSHAVPIRRASSPLRHTSEGDVRIEEQRSSTSASSRMSGIGPRAGRETTHAGVGEFNNDSLVGGKSLQYQTQQKKHGRRVSWGPVETG
mmetsp:Transcript_26703/g.43647  ORF Transcript_26703/g.43647 Transcript_26703/m.43647 type:complete len:648 (+) Transcript_26703:1178-3121(+)